jgi:hypothetical protein
MKNALGPAGDGGPLAGTRPAGPAAGLATAAALTGGFQRALWVCGLTALAAIPVAFVLIRRTGSVQP